MTRTTQANDLASLLQSDKLPSANTEAGCETYSDWLSPNERARTYQSTDKISSYQNQLISTNETRDIDKPLENTSVLNPSSSRSTAIRGNETSQVYLRDGNSSPYQSNFRKINVIANTDNPNNTAHVPYFTIYSQTSGIKPSDSSLIYSQSRDRYFCQPHVVNINGLVDSARLVQTTSVLSSSAYPEFSSNRLLYENTAIPKVCSSLPYITTGEINIANCSSYINSNCPDSTSDNNPHSTNYLRQWNVPEMGKTLPCHKQITGYNVASNRPDSTSGYSEDVIYPDSTNMLDNWNTGVVSYSPASTLQQTQEQSKVFRPRQSHICSHDNMPCHDNANMIDRNRYVTNYHTKPVAQNTQLANVGPTHEAEYNIRTNHITPTHPSQQNVARWIYKHSEHMNPVVITPHIIPADRFQGQNPGISAPNCRSPQMTTRTYNLAQYQPQNSEAIVRYHRPQRIVYPDVSYSETEDMNNPNKKKIIPGQQEFGYPRSGSQTVPPFDEHSPNKIRKLDTDPSTNILYKDVTVSPELKPSVVDKRIHRTSFGSLYSLIDSVSWDDINFSEKFDVDKFLDDIESKSDRVLPTMQTQSCSFETRFTTSGESLLKRYAVEPNVSETMSPVRHHHTHRPAVAIVSNPGDQKITWTSSMPPDLTPTVTESYRARGTSLQNEVYQNLIQNKDPTKYTSSHVTANISSTGTLYKHHSPQNVPGNIETSTAGRAERDVDYRTDNLLETRTKVHIVPQEETIVPYVRMGDARISRDDHSVTDVNVRTTEINTPKTEILPTVIIKELFDSEHTTPQRKENISSPANLRSSIEHLLSIPDIHSTSNKSANVQAPVTAHTSLPNLSQSMEITKTTSSFPYTCAGNLHQSQIQTKDPNVQSTTDVGNTQCTTPHSAIPVTADTTVPQTTCAKMDRFDMERLWKQQLASRGKKN